MIKEQTTKEIIDEIHETFYTEVEKLLNNAKKFNSLESDKQFLIDKSERLKNLGFINTKEVLVAENELKKINKLKEENKGKEDLIAAINYFMIKYPNYKFITEKSVKKICKKYGLVYGEIKRYEGTVPSENLKQIENFTIKDEDRCYKKIITYNRRFVEDKIFFVGHEYFKRKRKTRRPEIKKIEITPAPLEIAAPIKDFNMIGMEIKNHELVIKKEIPDPIVLQPVFFNGIKHYLIVTAWGEEGSDELIFNEKNN